MLIENVKSTTLLWNGLTVLSRHAVTSSFLLFGHSSPFLISKTGTTKTTFESLSKSDSLWAKALNSSRILRLGMTSTSIRKTWLVAAPRRATLRNTLWGYGMSPWRKYIYDTFQSLVVEFFNIRSSKEMQQFSVWIRLNFVNRDTINRDFFGKHKIK